MDRTYGPGKGEVSEIDFTHIYIRSTLNDAHD